VWRQAGVRREVRMRSKQETRRSKELSGKGGGLRAGRKEKGGKGTRGREGNKRDEKGSKEKRGREEGDIK
jgi:hypothetical protein